MKADQSAAEFEAFIGGTGNRLADLSLEDALDAMMAFHAERRAGDGRPEPDADMLLFQWGAYSWDGRPETFQVDFTRQFISGDPSGDADDDRMSQLSLRFHFTPDGLTEALGAGQRWSEPDGLDAFAGFVRESPPLRAGSAMPPLRVELDWREV